MLTTFSSTSTESGGLRFATLAYNRSAGLVSQDTADDVALQRLRLSSYLPPNDLRSPALHWRMSPRFQHQNELYAIPYARFSGAPAGGDRVHLGVFAGIHGDEPQSTLGLWHFMKMLVQTPALAAGFTIHAYPACNPVGLRRGTRWNGHRKDLNREFWQNSEEWEVRFLEQELQRRRFEGIISLHCDDTSHGLYGFLSGRQPSTVLSASLLKPALLAGESYLPRNCDECIDGFGARDGILRTCYKGVLQAPVNQTPPPFEITFETPQLADSTLQVHAFSAALATILKEYRQILAHAPNL